MRTHPAGKTGALSLGVLTAALLTAIPHSTTSLEARTGQAPAEPVPFESVLADLSSADAGIRLRAVRMLRDAAYPEAAIPLASRITDARDDVQFEAIAAELNIFLAEPIASSRRVGLVIEKRSAIGADQIFELGPLTTGAHPVPFEVLDALRAAARDNNPRLRLEAVYAFGVLAVEPGGSRRAKLLAEAGPDLAAMLGAVDRFHRYAAVRVLGRVFARRLSDPPIDTSVGDAVIGVLNDPDADLRRAAMQTLGAMRYERAVASLMELFQFYGTGAMAEAALDAIARIGHPLGSSLLAMQLSSPDERIAIAAIEGLARTADTAHVAEVQTAAGPERAEAIQLAGSFASILLDGAAIDPLIEGLAKVGVRDQARDYLVEAAPGRTDRYAPQLQNTDPAVRLVLVDALGLSDDVAAIPLLMPMAGDADPQVARAVSRALARLGQLEP